MKRASVSVKGKTESEKTTITGSKFPKNLKKNPITWFLDLLLQLSTQLIEVYHK